MVHFGGSKCSGEKAAMPTAEREVRRGAGFLDYINCAVISDI
jgi:hypothetical protein